MKETIAPKEIFLLPSGNTENEQLLCYNVHIHSKKLQAPKSESLATVTIVAGISRFSRGVYQIYSSAQEYIRYTIQIIASQYKHQELHSSRPQLTSVTTQE